MDDIDIQLIDVPKMYLLSIRKNVQKEDYPAEYLSCFENINELLTEDRQEWEGTSNGTSERIAGYAVIGKCAFKKIKRGKQSVA